MRNFEAFRISIIEEIIIDGEFLNEKERLVNVIIWIRKKKKMIRHKYWRSHA